MARPWFPFYPVDYSADTDHLSLTEHGAYLSLILHYYKTGNKLPTNEKQLIRVCKAFEPEEVEAMKNVLDQFFVKTDTGYENARIEKELEKSNYISKVRSKARKNKNKKTTIDTTNDNTNEVSIDKTNDKSIDSTIVDTTHNSQLKPSIGETGVFNSIPDDYKPSENFIARMHLAGITKTIINKQTETFIAHHQAKKTTSDNWDAEFKLWLMRGKANGWHKRGDSNNAAHKNNDGMSAGDIAREKIQQEIDNANCN